MAGYNGYSMSNNAVAAYEAGLLPASKIKQVPANLIEQFVRYEEWHHSSKAYNRVKFYNRATVLAVFGLQEAVDGDGDPIHANPAAVAALAAWKASRKSGSVTHENCTVEWIEWTGSLKRPTATERKETGCTVTVKGQTAKVVLPNGKVITKQLSTRGFSWRTTS